MLQLRTVVLSDYQLVFVQEEFSIVYCLVIFFPAHSVQDLLSKDRMLQVAAQVALNVLGEHMHLEIRVYSGFQRNIL